MVHPINFQVFFNIPEEKKKSINGFLELLTTHWHLKCDHDYAAFYKTSEAQNNVGLIFNSVLYFKKVHVKVRSDYNLSYQINVVE